MLITKFQMNENLQYNVCYTELLLYSKDVSQNHLLFSKEGKAGDRH